MARRGNVQSLRRDREASWRLVFWRTRFLAEAAKKINPKNLLNEAVAAVSLNKSGQ